MDAVLALEPEATDAALAEAAEVADLAVVDVDFPRALVCERGETAAEELQFLLPRSEIAHAEGGGAGELIVAAEMKASTGLPQCERANNPVLPSSPLTTPAQHNDSHSADANSPKSGNPGNEDATDHKTA